jgi:RHS repeat-associated protein
VATTYAYNAKNQLLNISTVNGAGTTLVSFAYTLAPTGNRTKIVEHDGVTRNYAYDNLYRLTDEHVKQGTAPDAPTAWRNQFAYDSVGNRLEQVRQTENGTPQPVVYTYDERDRLLTENGISGPVTYGWDANGNQTAKSGADGATYTWDVENRLVRVELVGGTIVEHSYDADGTRIRTTTTSSVGPPATVDYLVDPWHQTSVRGGLILSQVVAETDETSGLSAYHARGDDLLATLRPETSNPSNLVAGYFHAEGIGTIRALTDEQGNVTDRYSLEAFGTLLSHEGDDPNAYLFAGEPLDPNSGFYYNRARWLDGERGTFISSDPFLGRESEPLSLHRYTYAQLDPANLIDPTGLDSLGEALTSLAVKSMTFAIRHPVLTTMLGLVANALIPEEFHNVMMGLPNPFAEAIGTFGKGEIRFFQLVKSARFRSFMSTVSRQIAGRFWRQVGDRFEDALAARLLKGAERQFLVNASRKIRIDFLWRGFLIEAKTGRSLDAGELVQLAEAANCANLRGFALKYFFLVKPTKGTIETIQKAGGQALWFFEF